MSDAWRRLVYLGVDWGVKRIGVAISSPGGIVSALKVIPGSKDMTQTAQAIAALVEEYGADAVVIGLPLNMDGTAGPQAAHSRSLARALRAIRPELPVFLHDERLTSHAADRHLAERSLTRRQKRSRQDAVAAKVLLESFLASPEQPAPF